MKQLLYIFCILGLTACNANKQEKIDTTTTPTQAPVASGALNPAHGAPGHKCELPVGAPLNSAPTQGNMPQASPQMPAPVAPTTNANGPKLNPEHGQPGHKCELPVGAPLT